MQSGNNANKAGSNVNKKKNNNNNRKAIQQPQQLSGGDNADNGQFGRPPNKREQAMLEKALKKNQLEKQQQQQQQQPVQQQSQAQPSAEQTQQMPKQKAKPKRKRAESIPPTASSDDALATATAAPTSSKRKRAAANANVSATVFVADDNANNNTDGNDESPFSSKPFPSHLHTYKALSEGMGFKTMMKIQEQTIEPMLAGKDIWAAAKTGSGKSLAFLIPLLEKIITAKMQRPQQQAVRGSHALILVPIRELTLQLETDIKNLLKFHGHLRITVERVIGGGSDGQGNRMAQSPPDIIIATPGRLYEYIAQRRVLSKPFFQNVTTFIMDEVDQLLELGFIAHVTAIVNILPKVRQTAIFSATFPPEVMKLAPTDPSKTVKISTISSSTATACVSTITQEYLIVGINEFDDILYRMLRINANQKTIVFFQTAKLVDFYAKFLTKAGINNISAYSGRKSQSKREAEYTAFRTAKGGVLMCTDVAARGVDMKDVGLVIMAGAPASTEVYVHRSGRTAREGKSGRCVTLLRDFEKFFIGLAESKGIVFDQELDRSDVMRQSASIASVNLKSVLAADTELQSAANRGVVALLYHLACQGRKALKLSSADIIAAIRTIAQMYGMKQLTVELRSARKVGFSTNDYQRIIAPLSQQ